jgi:hypothetical protein
LGVGERREDENGVGGGVGGVGVSIYTYKMELYGMN